MIDVDSQRVNGGDGSVDTNVKLPTETQCVVVATPTIIIHTPVTANLPPRRRGFVINS